MKCVHLWKCDCGTRLKAITECSGAPSARQETVSCPNCRKGTQVDGNVIEIFVEDQEKLWVRSEQNDRQLR